MRTAVRATSGKTNARTSSRAIYETETEVTVKVTNNEPFTEVNVTTQLTGMSDFKPEIAAHVK